MNRITDSNVGKIEAIEAIGTSDETDGEGVGGRSRFSEAVLAVAGGFARIRHASRERPRVVPRVSSHPLDRVTLAIRRPVALEENVADLPQSLS